VEEAKEALIHSERAVHRAKASRHPNRFALGYSPDINPRLISNVRSISVQLWALSLRSAFTLEELHLIRAGELDAGVVILPVADDALTVESVLKEPLLVALPESHALCKRRTRSAFRTGTMHGGRKCCWVRFVPSVPHQF
jgi:LysR family transcriptional regulator, hydrogen peroxide-inducible genes activator